MFTFHFTFVPLPFYFLGTKLPIFLTVKKLILLYFALCVYLISPQCTCWSVRAKLCHLFVLCIHHCYRGLVPFFPHMQLHSVITRWKQCSAQIKFSAFSVLLHRAPLLSSKLWKEPNGCLSSRWL